MEPKYKVNKFLNEVRLYLELYKKVKSKDPKDFERFVDDLLRRYNSSSQISIEVAGDREALIAVNNQIKKDFSHFGEYIDDKISEILKEGIKKDIPRNELYNRASRELRKGKQYAYTWINTAENASNQAVTIRKNIEAGVKYFKYAGPPADREFCANLLDKVFPIEEIEKMDNGQGLPVLYYKGGYNCRHRWVPVLPDEIPTKENGQSTAQDIKLDNNLLELEKAESKKTVIDWCKKNVTNAVTNNFSALETNDIKQIAKTVYSLNNKFGLPPLKKLAKEKDDNNASYYGATNVRLDHPMNSDSIRIGKNVTNYLNSEHYKGWLNRFYNDKKGQGITENEQYHSFYLSLNTEDVVVHEFGHRFHYSHFNSLTELYNTNIHNEDWIKYKKGRASDSVHEYIAEMFSRFYHGQPVPKELADFFNNSIKKE